MDSAVVRAGTRLAFGRKFITATLVTFGLISSASAASLSLSAMGQTSTDPTAPAAAPAALPGPTVITQNADTTTLNPSTGASCTYAENHHIRRFLLNAGHGITGAFTINTVQIGVQEAGDSGVGSQPIEIRLYSIPSGSPLIFANLTLLGSAPATAPDGVLYFLEIPVSGTVSDPTTDDLVVDIYVPGGPYFFPGANSAGQTGATYIAASTCGIPEITDVASVGFPNDNIVVLVSGQEVTPIPEECGPGFEGANIIIGTEGNDALSGTRDRDVIFGKDGDDKIDGGGGDDCLIGGNGNDYLLGGPGNDVLIANGEGKGGPATEDAIHERNRLNGSRGTDTCYGGYGSLYMESPSYVTTFDSCEIIYEPTPDH